MKKSISRNFRLLTLCGLTILVSTTGTKFIARSAMAADATWSDWTPLDDKAQKGIDWRTSQGDAVGTDGLFNWNYQFRNRYPKKVKFQSTQTYQDKNGANQTEVKVWIIGPQETDGATLTGKALGAIEITKPEVFKVPEVVPPPKPPVVPIVPPIIPPVVPVPAPNVIPAPVIPPPPTTTPDGVGRGAVKPEAPKTLVPDPQNATDARAQQAEARAREAELRAQQAESRAKAAEDREKLALDKVKQEAVEQAKQGLLKTMTPPAGAQPDAALETRPPARNLSTVSWQFAPQAPIAAHTKPVGALAYSPDGAIVASCSWSLVNGAQVSEILLQDAASGQTLRRMEGHWETAWNGKGPKPPWVGHWGKVNDIAFSPNGTTLVSGGEDGRVTLWDVKSGNALKALPKLERPVLALVWTSPKTICGLSRDGKVATWNLTDNRCKFCTLGASASGDWVRVGTFSSDGQRLATGDTNGGLAVWGLPTGSLVRKLNNSLYQDLDQPQGVEATALAFSPDGKLLLSANQAHIYLNAADKSSGVAEYNAKLLFAGQRVRQLVFAPDGQTAAAVCDSKIVILNPSAKTATAARLGELPATGGSALEIAVSPRQDTFVTSGAEGNVVLWK